MATIPNLWPDDIQVDVLPPVAILRAQENMLANKTQGILHAELTATETEHFVQHHLDLVAPALNGYRERLLSASHRKDRIYPVTVAADCLSPKQTHLVGLMPQPSTEDNAELQKPNEKLAATQNELLEIIRSVLHSADTRSLIQSLIAKSNEINKSEVQTQEQSEDD